MVQQSIEGARFLDLFAGSGGMGFEALSRGACDVVFVDSSREAILSIERNLTSLEVNAGGRIVKGDVFNVLQKMEKLGERYDIVYADPPYASQENGKDSLGEQVLRAVDEKKILKEGGHLFIEEGKHVSLEDVPLKTLKFIKRKLFGDSILFQFVQSLGK